MFKEFTTITIYGKPVPKSMVNYKHRIANSPKTKQAMTRRTIFLKNHRMRNSLATIESNPVALEIFYYHERPKRLEKINGVVYKTTKPDIDNLTKLLLDSCTQSGLWGDDCQVVKTEIHDLFCSSDCKPRTIIIITVGDKNEPFINS